MLQRTLDKFKEFDVINLYTQKGYSLNQLEIIVGSDKRSIRNYLLANGVEVKGIKNPEVFSPNVLVEGKSGRRFNYKFFDKIDTEEKAYWLGFIFADGCITHGEFSLNLQAKDVGHLHKFNRSVECTENNVHYTKKVTDGKTYDGDYWFCYIQMAMKWLREVHKIHIQVEAIVPEYYKKDEYVYRFHYKRLKHVPIYNNMSYIDDTQYVSCEQACEAAIKYCLENLI